jgi:hypothetical protein
MALNIRNPETERLAEALARGRSAPRLPETDERYGPAPAAASSRLTRRSRSV